MAAAQLRCIPVPYGAQPVLVVLLALLAILCLDIIRLPMTCTKRCVADALYVQTLVSG